MNRGTYPLFPLFPPHHSSQRPGQTPQRMPNIGPNPPPGAFRPQYPAYGMPPRSVLPGIHTPPNVRVGSQAFPAPPTPNFLQQRAQNSFPFGGGIQQQQQQSQPPSQHNPQTPLSHTPLQPQQPPSQQAVTTPAPTSLPPHLSSLSALTSAPSASSTSEVGLDPNDFPALGSIPSNSLNTPSTNHATSYATQAGTGVATSANGAQSATAVNQQREFTVDDFPALGVPPSQPQAPPPTSQQHQQPQNTTDASHPPGLNGFQQQQHADQQHRQNLLGSLSGAQQQPGLLNLAQARGAHAGFQSQSEAEKRVRRLFLIFPDFFSLGDPLASVGGSAQHSRLSPRLLGDLFSSWG